jgi:hypothetical protein
MTDLKLKPPSGSRWKFFVLLPGTDVMEIHTWKIKNDAAKPPRKGRKARKLIKKNAKGDL